VTPGCSRKRPPGRCRWQLSRDEGNILKSIARIAAESLRFSVNEIASSLFLSLSRLYPRGGEREGGSQASIARAPEKVLGETQRTRQVEVSQSDLHDAHRRIVALVDWNGPLSLCVLKIAGLLEKKRDRMFS